MHAFVTGSSGFVGSWLLRHLEDSGDTVTSCAADITDAPSLQKELLAVSPQAVYHLAGQANVGASWNDTVATFEVNAVGTLNVLEAVRQLPMRPRVLVIGSADVYGTVKADDLPLTEDTPLRPVSPYAASKVAAEFVALQAYLGYGTPVIRARAFNHVGPGQNEGFVVSALAKRIAEAERAGTTAVSVGNLDTRRDFSDVRDVVRAYRLLMEHGTPGEVYNVCSGNDISIREIADRLMAASGHRLDFVVSGDQQRSVDVPVLSGDSSRLRAATGWAPLIPLDQTLADALGWWRQQLGSETTTPTEPVAAAVGARTD